MSSQDSLDDQPDEADGSGAEPIGVSFGTDRYGDIITGTLNVTGGDSVSDEQEEQEQVESSATTTTTVELTVVIDNGHLAQTTIRPLLPPPPRPPRSPPLGSPEDFLGLGSVFEVVEYSIEPFPEFPSASTLNLNLDEGTSIIRQRPSDDDEPSRATWPPGWDTHHDYFLWSCRGTVEIITDHLQAVFCFDPPIEETFVAARLGGVNAFKQLTFLRTYLPGETQSLQRAEARGVLYEANLSDPAVRGGYQQLDVKQPNPGDRDYVWPIMPPRRPCSWGREDDCFAAMYIGEHPDIFMREYGFNFPFFNMEFFRIRMAQIPHLNITWSELVAAEARRQILRMTHPHRYADRDLPRAPGFI